MDEKSYLIVDFDSTVVKLEALEEIAEEALKENPNKKEIQEKIKAITERGMRGEISFAKSLKDRLKLFSANRANVEKVADKIRENITDSFLENKDFFKKYGQQIYIISGGFKECIYPVSDFLGIPRENILANEFIFDENDQVVGINENNLACKTQGKVKQTEKLNLKGKVFVVGDGWTDFEIKREEAADFFLAFTENIFRKSVVELADFEAKNFDEVLDFIKLKSS